MTPVVIAEDALVADANGAWFEPPEFVRHAALIAELDREFEQ